MRRPRVLGSASVIALVASALVSGPVAAAGTLTVEPPSGVPGQTLTAKGSHSFGVQLVTLRWDSTDLQQTGSSGSDGMFEIPFTVPAGAAVGGHVLRACVRGDCSITPPFTVAVTLPPPSANPTPAATPAASPPASPIPSSVPSLSPGPVESASPGTSAEPTADASASGAIAGPTVVPTALPADPNTPGGVKLAWPWLLVVGGVLGLLILALYVLLGRNEKWLRGETNPGFDEKAPESLTADNGPPKAGKTPKLYEAMTRGTHAPPKPPDELIRHEATHAGDAADAVDQPDADAPSAPKASKEVKLKGKNIGEN